MKNFAGQFEETNPSEITLDTFFRSLPEWSSMMALIIIAMVDENYKVPLTGDEIRSSQTVRDIFKIVAAKAVKAQ